MKKQNVLEACRTNLKSFQETIKDEAYQARGILNSEALLIVSLASYYKVKLIIESGRARGNSTNLIAKFFDEKPDVKVISIDYEQNEDTKYSEELLKKYNNVETIYGDSHEELPKLVSEDCVVFIDGPKDESAIELTSKLLETKKVKAVLVHDLYRSKFIRDVCERIFTNSFFTDDIDFVNEFKDLDDDCWEQLAQRGDKPYQINGKELYSYGPTIGVFFNSDNPFSEPSYSNYLEHKKKISPTLKKLVLYKFDENSLFFKLMRSVYRVFK